MKYIALVVTAVAISASLAQSEVVLVSMEGSLQNISDPDNVLDGFSRWTASISIDTDLTVIGDGAGNTLTYSGDILYRFGQGTEFSIAGDLHVHDGDIDDDDDFDFLNIRFAGAAFGAIDFSRTALDSTDLPPFGLTFDAFSSNNPSSTITAFGFTADIVTDTLTVTPSPSSIGVFAFALLGLRRNRQ